MKRIALAILAIAFVIGSVAPSFAVEMNARGSWRVATSWYKNAGDFDSNSADETFRARQRARVWFDFAANENLKAVLGLEIGDVTWGNGAGALSTDSNTAIEVKHAYLDFNLPNTKINIKAGLQPIYIPGNLGSLVLDDDAAALMISTPVNDMVSITAGWVRAVDLNDNTHADATTITSGVGDEEDTLALLAPVNADGFSVTPYILYTMIGRQVIGNDTDDATMWHAGFSTKVDMFDPIVVLADFVYGSRDAETKSNDASGCVADLAVDYKMDVMTPEVFGYYASGENTSTKSAIMPTISPDLNFSTFGTDGSPLGEGLVLTSDPSDNPFWAIGLKLKDISVVEGLSHTFTIYYAKGTSDKNAGVDIDEKDSFVEANFDSKYQIYDELAAYLELGYININMDDDSLPDNAYKCSLGVKYDF